MVVLESTGDLVALLRRRRWCPVTHNLVTRMKKDSFVSSCNHHREQGANLYCEICEGRHLPDGLTFIEEGDMALTHGRCESCHKDNKSLSNHFGQRVCSTCVSLRGMINNQPQVVIDQLRHFKVELPVADGHSQADEQLADELDLARERLEKLERELEVSNSRLEDLSEAHAADLARLVEVRSDLELTTETLVAVTAERDELVRRARLEQPTEPPRLSGHKALGRLAWGMAEAMATGEPWQYTWGDVALLRDLGEA